MTPHQSFARTSQMPASPFAVPDKIFGLTLSLDFIDRGTHCAWASSATGSAQARGPREKPFSARSAKTPNIPHTPFVGFPRRKPLQ